MYFLIILFFGKNQRIDYIQYVAINVTDYALYKLVIMEIHYFVYTTKANYQVYHHHHCEYGKIYLSVMLG